MLKYQYKDTEKNRNFIYNATAKRSIKKKDANYMTLYRKISRVVAGIKE
jgi:hypothetical protein